MRVRDVNPSRIDKAKQIIADILQESRGINISLTAFAKVPHIITPLTSDIENIKNLLPYIDTSLPHLQGSDLNSAILQAESLFPSNSPKNHILLISSGNLENYKINNIKNILDKKNIKINTILVATKNGAPLINEKGEFSKNNSGKIIISKANQNNLAKIAHEFGGKHFNSSNNLQIAENFLNSISTKKSINSERFKYYKNLARTISLVDYPCYDISFFLKKKFYLYLAFCVFCRSISGKYF